MTWSSKQCDAKAFPPGLQSRQRNADVYRTFLPLIHQLTILELDKSKIISSFKHIFFLSFPLVFSLEFFLTWLGAVLQWFNRIWGDFASFQDYEREKKGSPKFFTRDLRQNSKTLLF